MTTAANTFAPGSPSSASSAAGGLAQSAMKALGFGGGAQGAAQGLGIGAGSSSGSSSGNAAQNAGYSADDFNVNFGNGVSQGGMPTWFLIGIALLGVYAWRQFR